MELFDEKQSILMLNDPQVENQTQSLDQRISSLRMLMNVNKGISLLFFGLTLILTIDYFLSHSEIFEIPKSCISADACEFEAFTPVSKGLQYVYLEFYGFNQNYKSYMDSVSLG